MNPSSSTMPTSADTSMSNMSTLITQQVQLQTAALRSRISDLENKNSELQRVLGEQRVDGQQVGVVSGNVRGGTLKAAKPAMYTGEMGSDVEAWLFQVLQYAHITGIADADRAKWSATYLSGKAAAWWRGMVMQDAGGKIDDITWDKFYSGLVAMFKPVNAKKIARDKLAALRQTHSVAKYNHDISQLFLDIGDIHDSEKLDRYIRGLKDKIRMEVELVEPTTLADAMAKAQRVDGITYHSRMMQHGGQMGGNTYRTSMNDSTAMDLGMVYGDDDVDADVDTVNAVDDRSIQRGDSRMRNNNSRGINRSSTPLQRVSREVFKYCQEHRLCLRCKEPGHIARSCTKAVKPLNMKAH
jgi:hypothetical protein